MSSNSGADVLTGYYKLLFLYIEPISTITPAVLTWIFPGASWFHWTLVPSKDGAPPSGFLEDRTLMAVLQLANCYFLLGLLSSFVLRATRSALPNDAVAQERIVHAMLTALAIADVSHTVLTFVALPKDQKFSFFEWNATTHGNITFTIVLFASRVSWMQGISRKVYSPSDSKKTKGS